MDDEERNKKFSIKISKALGQQQLQALSQRQAAHLNQALGRLLKEQVSGSNIGSGDTGSVRSGSGTSKPFGL